MLPASRHIILLAVVLSFWIFRQRDRRVNGIRREGLGVSSSAVWNTEVPVDIRAVGKT